MPICLNLTEEKVAFQPGDRGSSARLLRRWDSEPARAGNPQRSGSLTQPEVVPGLSRPQNARNALELPAFWYFQQLVVLKNLGGGKRTQAGISQRENKQTNPPPPPSRGEKVS